MVSRIRAKGSVVLLLASYACFFRPRVVLAPRLAQAENVLLSERRDEQSVGLRERVAELTSELLVLRTELEEQKQRLRKVFAVAPV